jgi:MoaA/NifB/PqqE/SkfB family radical SAM enzyme
MDHELKAKVEYIRKLNGFCVDNFKKVTAEEIQQLEKQRPTTRMLSIHTINGCNLSCRGCNHNSSLLSAKSSVDIDQLIEDIENILPKIYVWSHVSIIGGEPLLEPRTKEVTRLVRELCYGDRGTQPCKVKLFSNGSRLLHEKEWIADEMLKGVIFRLTFHRPSYTQSGKKDWENAYEFIQYLIERKVDIDNNLELSESYLHPDNTPEMWFDLVKYQFNEDGSIKYYPHEDGNPTASFDHCTCPNSQLYNGHLWKCPMIAYLRESLEATDQLNDPHWKKYLNYTPTSIHDSEESIRNSFQEVVEPHWICNMCPSRPKIEYAAKIQLKGQKKTVEMFNPKNYESI